MEDEPSSPPSSDAETSGASPLRTFVGLFFVPLLVVGLCVGIFIGFGWIAYDRHSTEDYLNDLRSGWRPRRAQAAYELSKILVVDPAALDDTPGAKEELRELYQQAERGEEKRYLSLVLGYTRDPEAVPLLIESLADPDSETRIYALWALGTSGDPRAESALTLALQDEDAGIRKTAAYALGELGLASSVAPLRALLEDSVADARWNAALAISRLGSDAGLPVLMEMIDRNLTAQVPGITPAQVEEAMTSAVAALAATGARDAVPRLRTLADTDPNLKVRQAALSALEVLEVP